MARGLEKKRIKRSSVARQMVATPLNISAYCTGLTFNSAVLHREMLCYDGELGPLALYIGSMELEEDTCELHFTRADLNSKTTATFICRKGLNTFPDVYEIVGGDRITVSLTCKGGVQVNDIWLGIPFLVSGGSSNKKIFRGVVNDGEVFPSDDIVEVIDETSPPEITVEGESTEGPENGLS